MLIRQLHDLGAWAYKDIEKVKQVNSLSLSLSLSLSSVYTSCLIKLSLRKSAVGFSNWTLMPRSVVYSHEKVRISNP